MFHHIVTGLLGALLALVAPRRTVDARAPSDARLADALFRINLRETPAPAVLAALRKRGFVEPDRLRITPDGADWLSARLGCVDVRPEVGRP